MPPDSRMLTSFVRRSYCQAGGFLVSWDLQTGGVVSAIELEGPREMLTGKAYITYSVNGKAVAVLSRYESSTIISIYDVISGVYMHNVDHPALANPDLPLETRYVFKIWTHGESLRFATPGSTAITIWEVGFVLGATPTGVETFTIPRCLFQTGFCRPIEQRFMIRTEFHTASCRLALARVGGPLTVWDFRAAKSLLQSTDVAYDPSTTFSDGRFFAHITSRLEVYFWKEPPTGYTLFVNFAAHIPLFSPSGESIVTFSDIVVQLWHTKDFATSTSSVLTRLPLHSEDYLLEFFPGRPLAVTTQKKDQSVTVLDLVSGVPQLTINTSIEVYGLRLTDNIVVAIGDKKAITWNLLEGISFLMRG